MPTDDLLIDAPGAQIPTEEVEIRASRSSGPGGQHANVTSSRIEATLDLESCAGLSDEARARLIDRFGPRVTAIAQDSRSQLRNRELALTRLSERIADALVVQPPRRKTKPSRGALERARETKRRNSARKRDRRNPLGE
jgi:ribosome-associated protein